MRPEMFVRSIWRVAEKDMRIYYFKGPVVVFGLLFPLLMFFTFFIGRNLDIISFYPGFLGMMLFFTASSVGPLITPWEKREKTYERLLSLPVVLESIILGDLMAGAIFGIMITTIVWIVSVLLLHLPLMNAAGTGHRVCTRFNGICRPRDTPCVADNEQPLEYYDALEPCEVAPDLRERDLYPFKPVAGLGMVPDLAFSLNLSRRPVPCSPARKCSISCLRRFYRAYRYNSPFYRGDEIHPREEPDQGDIKNSECDRKRSVWISHSHLALQVCRYYHESIGSFHLLEDMRHILVSDREHSGDINHENRCCRRDPNPRPPDISDDGAWICTKTL